MPNRERWDGAWRFGAALLVVTALCARETCAALPVGSLRLATGFGVDTTGAPAREVLAVWRRYLLAPDASRDTLWSAAERVAGQPYDLIGPYVYQGFSNFTVVRLAPAAGLPDTYVIRTLVSDVEDSTRAVRPLALYRVYATREGGRWVLANALPRTTRDWRHEQFGAVRFVFPSSYPFDAARARATATFVDSLAAAFGLPAPQPISYYFTTDLDAMFDALGLEFFPLGTDSIGGRSNTIVRNAYAGMPTNAEAYRHELAHIVLAPEVGPRTAPLLAEGLMTWAGGSAGLDYAGLLAGLARYLAAHPALTLEAILRNPPPRTGTLDVGYDGLAVLCDLVHRRAGLAGLRAVLGAGRTPEAVLDAAARQLGMSRAALGSAWRKSILEHRR